MLGLVRWTGARWRHHAPRAWGDVEAIEGVDLEQVLRDVAELAVDGAQPQPPKPIPGWAALPPYA